MSRSEGLVHDVYTEMQPEAAVLIGENRRGSEQFWAGLWQLLLTTLGFRESTLRQRSD